MTEFRLYSIRRKQKGSGHSENLEEGTAQLLYRPSVSNLIRTPFCSMLRGQIEQLNNKWAQMSMCPPASRLRKFFRSFFSMFWRMEIKMCLNPCIHWSLANAPRILFCWDRSARPGDLRRWANQSFGAGWSSSTQLVAMPTWPQYGSSERRTTLLSSSLKKGSE